MDTLTTNSVWDKAVVSEDERKYRYVWRSFSASCDTLAHTNEPVGIQVALAITHDTHHKQYRADISQVHWNRMTSDPRIIVEFFSPFEPALYPRATVLRRDVARYSAKSFDEFALSAKHSLANHENETVRKLWALAHTLTTPTEPFYTDPTTGMVSWE